MNASRAWLLGFGAVAIAHLLLLAVEAEPWDSVTKVLLAPALIGWVLSERGPRLLVLALVFCLGGDALLEVDGWFVAGMASFAAAHVCFIALFAPRARHRPAPAIVVSYAVAGIAVVGWAWGGLEPALRAAVPVYAALLVATALTAAAAHRVAGLGGALFLLSDGLIALGEAGRLTSESTLVPVLIMVLYAAAIALLTIGGLRADARTGAHRVA